MLHLMLNINTHINIKSILLSILFNEITNWYLRAYKKTNSTYMFCITKKEKRKFFNPFCLVCKFLGL